MEELKLFIQDEIANLAFKRVASDESLIKTRLLDSILVVELLVSIEEKIGKQIPQHLVNPEHLDTIDLMISTIESLGS